MARRAPACRGPFHALNPDSGGCTMDSPAQRACGIAAGRLNLADYAANFSDAHPALNRSQALIEAERCYYCYDAPCTTACPTSIDVPAFIEIGRASCRERV